MSLGAISASQGGWEQSLAYIRRVSHHVAGRYHNVDGPFDPSRSRPLEARLGAVLYVASKNSFLPILEDPCSQTHRA